MFLSTDFSSVISFIFANPDNINIHQNIPPPMTSAYWLQWWREQRLKSGRPTTAAAKKERSVRLHFLDKTCKTSVSYSYVML